MSMDEYDIVVIGAGIHGAGVAQAGAAAGYSVLALEQTGIAVGTSSRSSKLIHGGLRYLESAQFALVRESLRERAILLKIAPHLVRLVPFFIPVYRETSRSPWKIRAGLSLYALLGGMGADNRFRSLRRRDWENPDGLKTQNLKAVFQYFDGQTDDAALTRAVLHSARELGAAFLCPARFTGAKRNKAGYRVEYEYRGERIHCHARALVNAAGPWVAEVSGLIEPPAETQPIELAQGAHLLADGELTAGIYYLEAPQDGRAVFAMPWHGRTLIGTTERTYEGRPEEVHMLASEETYLRQVFQHYFPTRELNITGRFAGLRVLPAGAGNLFSRPRETVFVTDSGQPVRQVSLYGGKLTGYRATAEKTIEKLRAALPQRQTRANTATLRLPE